MQVLGFVWLRPLKPLPGSIFAYPNIRCRGKNKFRASSEEVERRLETIPKPLRKALMPFQEEGIRFGLERQGRVLIADEMGVGKTVQALSLACCFQVGSLIAVSPPAWLSAFGIKARNCLARGAFTQSSCVSCFHLSSCLLVFQLQKAVSTVTIMEKSLKPQGCYVGGVAPADRCSCKLEIGLG